MRVSNTIAISAGNTGAGIVCYVPFEEREAHMHFGFTLKPDLPVERITGLTRQAEEAGFEYGWIFDSHILWKEPYPLLTLMAMNSGSLRLGPCVTNPAVRDMTVTASLFATLNIISGGRMELGIGRGDSSRRVLGKQPVTAARLEEAIRWFRELTAGREIEYDGQPTSITWATGSPRVWVAGYGPKVLNMAGRVAEGVILQFADPDLIAWCLEFVRQGAKEAGRDFDGIEVMAAAPAWISNDLARAREHVRWFPALVSNHVVDLVSRYRPEELPATLTSYVRDRPGYDYRHHCEVDSDNRQFVSDEVVDRFCIVGPAEAHLKKLKALEEAGVTQFNLYLMCGEEEAQVQQFKREIIPTAKRELRARGAKLR
jgi:probable F420-dependent oxidoreductase